MTSSLVEFILDFDEMKSTVDTVKGFVRKCDALVMLSGKQDDKGKPDQGIGNIFRERGSEILSKISSLRKN